MQISIIPNSFILTSQNTNFTFFYIDKEIFCKVLLSLLDRSIKLNQLGLNSLSFVINTDISRFLNRYKEIFGVEVRSLKLGAISRPGKKKEKLSGHEFHWPTRKDPATNVRCSSVEFEPLRRSTS